MSDDYLRYDRMVENALRGVVRQALETTAEHGPIGDHHFYITFRTHHPGVHISPHLMARHPEEMTIVLQHQFWDLEVNPELFAVTLSFSGVSERLVVPFASISGFADPSAKFGLQFQTVDMDDEDEAGDGGDPEPTPPATTGDDSGKVVALDRFRKK